MKSIQVQELKQRLQYGEKWLVLDVRQPEEYAICNFEGITETILVPLNKLHSQELKLPNDRPVVVTCHHGVRSRYAIEFLEGMGFTKLYNLEGGIHAWATEVNDQMPVY